MKVDTTNRQDVAFMNVILTACKESDKVSTLTVPWQFKSKAIILDGHPLSDAANATYEENLRTKRFASFCRMIVTFLLMVKMLVAVEDTVDSDGRSLDIVYIRTTVLGSLFMLLPNSLQRLFVYFVSSLLGAIFTISKYRWVGSVASVLTAAFRWTDYHNFTHVTIYISVLVGIASALVFGWLGSIFNTGSFKSDDSIV